MFSIIYEVVVFMFICRSNRVLKGIVREDYLEFFFDYMFFDYYFLIFREILWEEFFNFFKYLKWVIFLNYLEGERGVYFVRVFRKSMFKEVLFELKFEK